ncbi:MAG: restriction endonuclease [Phycisphaerales bacterium]|nr:restriction endonuclease [Phycisphaerales bacterium]
MSKTATKKSGAKKSTKSKGAATTPETIGERAEKLAAAATKPKGKTTKAKPDAKPKAMSCLDAAAHVLKAKGAAMNCKGMIDAMFAGKLWHSDAPTPAATLSSAILREVTTKGDSARFKKVDRGQFVFNA